MKITNNQGMPEPIYERCKLSSRVPVEHELHVTELINPPQMAALVRKNWNNIEKDASDFLWALFGQAAHKVLEETEASAMQEISLSYKLDDDYVLKGTADVYHNGNIFDYKFTSVWSYIYNPDGKEEWEKQLNMYAFLFREAGFEVKSATIAAMFRDWRLSEWKRMKDYPQVDVWMCSIDLWDHATVEQFIHERFRLHKQAIEQNIWDDCSKEERWHRGEKWAFYKQNRKRPRLYDTEAEAQSEKRIYEIATGESGNIEHRNGTDVRCLDYCDARDFCPQFERYERND